MKGSGWSPAYDVSSLLALLQNVLYEQMSEYSDPNKVKLKIDCETYTQSISLPKVHRNEVDETIAATKALDLSDHNDCADPWSIVPVTIQEQCKHLHASLSALEDKETFVSVLKFLINGESPAIVPALELSSKVDPDICCWFSKSDYTTEILGYGIVLDKKHNGTVNLSTDGAYISYGSFTDGLRQFPNKAQFDFFIPAWINPAHACERHTWVEILKKSLRDIGKIMKCTNHLEAATKIYPELINTMVVKMMERYHTNLRTFFVAQSLYLYRITSTLSKFLT